MSTEIDSYCLSSYLALRYVADADAAWMPGVAPALPVVEPGAQIPVATADETLAALRGLVDEQFPRDGAVLLSSGIDSAILAALVPEGTRSYTIRFVADGAIDESQQAIRYARVCGLQHEVLDVTWDDYDRSIDELVRHKRAPLHPVEPGLFCAARRARSHGCAALMVGNGADSTFGGLDSLLRRDWTFDEFVERYTFVEPAFALREPVSMVPVFEPYRRGADGIDVIGFLKTVHGLGITQAFLNGIGSGGCTMVEPYEELTLAAPLDLARVRAGHSKYILRDVFTELFPDIDIPEKIPFARPMDRWLAGWPGPRRREFRPDADYASLSGDQRWIVYCLERFLDVIEGDAGGR